MAIVKLGHVLCKIFLSFQKDCNCCKMLVFFEVQKMSQFFTTISMEVFIHSSFIFQTRLSLGFAGAAARVGASKHLDPLQQSDQLRST